LPAFSKPGGCLTATVLGSITGRETEVRRSSTGALPGPVRDVVEGTFADCAPRLELAEALPVLALDRTRVQLLVRNLVDNACRHGSGGAEPVTVSTRAEGDAVVFVVRDHGPGVSADQLTRLAEPFYRPDSARTRASGGVGLGLYLCRRVAQSHGATLALRNAHPGLEAVVHWPT
jgi:signal transduction histidine kinase